MRFHGVASALTRRAAYLVECAGGTLQFSGAFSGCQTELFHEESQIDAVVFGGLDAASFGWMRKTIFGARRVVRSVVERPESGRD